MLGCLLLLLPLLMSCVLAMSACMYAYVLLLLLC